MGRMVSAFVGDGILTTRDDSGGGDIIHYDGFLAIIRGISSRQSKSCYAIAVRDGYIRYSQEYGFGRSYYP